MTHSPAPAPDAHPGRAPGPGYETRDASVAGLLTFGVGLIVALVVVQFAILGFYHVFVSERPGAVKPSPPNNIYQQLRDLRDREDTALATYRWVDRKAGIVRIPIDRAIELVAENGVTFGKGPKTELEMNRHAGTAVPLPAPSTEADAKSPTGNTGPKP